MTQKLAETNIDLKNIENICLKDYEDMDETALRIQLAASYRIIESLGWSYLIFGHLTVRLPGPKNHFLINPFGLMYDEVTASNLVKIDLDGNIIGNSEWGINPAGFIIHSSIHSSKEDAHCVMHTHTTAGMAMAALAKGLINIDFNGTSFHNKVSYHDFEGVTIRKEECERLANDLGNNSVMILKNHGLLTTGKTIAEAFIKLYTLENACKVQLLARASGEKLEEVPIKIAENHIKGLNNSGNAKLAYKALVRKALKKDPSFIY